MARLALTLFGAFEAQLDGSGGRALPAKGQTLLPYLALHPGQAAGRDKVAALLWRGMGNEQALRNLRHAVFTIRKAKGDYAVAVSSDGRGLRLEPTAVAVDALRFERLLVSDATRDALRAAMAL